MIAPPSVHPNGGEYEWAISPEEADLAAAPTWLTDLLNRKAADLTEMPQRSTPRDGTYGRNALLAECGKVALAPMGQRNQLLNCAAFALGQLIAAGVLDPYDVADALLTAASRSGLGEDEARRTIASGLDAGLAKPRWVAR